MWTTASLANTVHGRFFSLRFTSSCTGWAQEREGIREEEARRSVALAVVITESSVSGR